MPVCWTSFVSIVLIASVFGAGSAAATPLGKAGDVGVDLPSATENSLPSPPSAPPPPSVPAVPQVPEAPVRAPKAPVPTPAVPQSPSVKTPAAKVHAATPNTSQPAPVASKPASSASGSSSPRVDLPSVRERASNPEAFAGASAGQARPRAGPPSARGRAAVGSISSARTAPRLLAYVWPAVAVGPIGKLLGILETHWEAAASLMAPEIPRLLSSLARVVQAERTRGLSGRPPVSKPSAEKASAGDSRGIPVPPGGLLSLPVFIAACAALMALLVLTVARELRAMGRWPL